MTLKPQTKESKGPQEKVTNVECGDRPLPSEDLTPKSLLGQNSGQILMEYLLLTVLIAGFVTIVTRRFVSRSDEPGILINMWSGLVQVVATDQSD